MACLRISADFLYMTNNATIGLGTLWVISGSKYVDYLMLRMALIQAARQHQEPGVPHLPARQSLVCHCNTGIQAWTAQYNSW